MGSLNDRVAFTSGSGKRKMLHRVYQKKKIEIGEIRYVGEVGRVGRFIHIKVWGLLKILFQIIHTII